MAGDEGGRRLDVPERLVQGEALPLGKLRHPRRGGGAIQQARCAVQGATATVSDRAARCCCNPRHLGHACMRMFIFNSCVFETHVRTMHRAAAAGAEPARRRSSQHYYHVPEPAAALEALEVELDRLISTNGGSADTAQAEAVACNAVCTLIKQECDAEVRPHPPPSPQAPADCNHTALLAQGVSRAALPMHVVLHNLRVCGCFTDGCLLLRGEPPHRVADGERVWGSTAHACTVQPVIPWRRRVDWEVAASFCDDAVNSTRPFAGVQAACLRGGMTKPDLSLRAQIRDTQRRRSGDLYCLIALPPPFVDAAWLQMCTVRMVLLCRRRGSGCCGSSGGRSTLRRRQASRRVSSGGGGAATSPWSGTRATCRLRLRGHRPRPRHMLTACAAFPSTTAQGALLVAIRHRACISRMPDTHVQRPLRCGHA